MDLHKIEDLRVVQARVHFILEIIVKKSRILHTTMLKLNENFLIDAKSIEDDVIPSRSMSDPPLSDIAFEKYRLDLV